METEDPLDFALSAIIKVANIASSLGVKSRQPVCGRLGAELLLVANHIDTAGLDQENRLRLRISKLLRDVEAICNVTKDSSNYFQSRELKADDSRLVATPNVNQRLSDP